jgi:rare lipoprotein A
MAERLLPAARSLAVAAVLAVAAGFAPAVLAQRGAAPAILAPRPAEPDPGSIPAAALLRKPGGFDTDDAPDAPPPDLDALADPVPRREPLDASANQPYTVFGRQYAPMTALAPYRRQGTASWYGRKFHGQRTSGGEVYDMFALTAAHPTLPIPSYARVTHLGNRRSVVVRINDRGPFAAGRIMDVSYAAAHKLGFVADTFAHVEVEALLPDTALASAPPAEKARQEAAARVPIAAQQSGFYLQLAAFADPANAESFSARIRRQLDGMKEPLRVAGRNGLYRVELGPFKDRARAAAAARKIRDALALRAVLVAK